ncbi:LysR family transcriptional regulator [Streptomyces tricolor]|nr:LysR family transcriptional regulator [Streptomyces tricolor]
MTQSTGLDLNLLVALDVLLEEESVQGAARRLHLSEPAMSRTLGRIRRALGDPVLVRAGRRMVPTPHALAVRAEVSAVVERARALFAPGRDTDLRALTRTFTILGHDAIAATHGAALYARAAREGPGIRLRFPEREPRGRPVPAPGHRRPGGRGDRLGRARGACGDGVRGPHAGRRTGPDTRCWRAS